ncbi:NUDIX domain-containing protein [Actinocorallia longicatena]|uniref:NUDIX domain-containing protein n=1 Tax=Actinocorallia longicatena TaxID=111803 RepID=A0ABP6QJ90_9ACTN
MLLVRRRRPPGAGLWSIPGGRVEAGESDAAALVREVLEETGLAVEAGEFLGRVEIPVPVPPDGPVLRPGFWGPRTLVYEVFDYRATVVGGELLAGSDAADARWQPFGSLNSLEMTAGLVNALRSWRVIPE